MILKGSQRSGAKQLSAHLLNDRDNDHVTVLEIKGFVSEDLRGALGESHAISKATKCKQFLFSLSLNPPRDVVAGEEDFLKAADEAEKALGLAGQPRAIIVHEKEGRRHAHVVWSRIDPDSLTAINLPFFKQKLTNLSKEIYLENGWRLPEGMRANGGKSPLNFTLSEWQQAKRLGLDPREVKDVFQEAWEHSDSVKAMGNALAERGFFIAKGDRRGFVAVDVQGEIYALPKWIGVRTKEVAEKFGSPEQLEPVEAVKKAVRARVTEKLKSFIAEVKTKHAQDAHPLLDEKAELVAKQRAERALLKEQQERRWKAETEARSERLRTGLKGLLDTITGRAKAIRTANEVDAYRAAKRDQEQRDELVLLQMEDRQELQTQFAAMRKKQAQDRRLLARDVVQFLRSAERRSGTDARRSEQERTQEANRPRTGGRDRGPRFEL